MEKYADDGGAGVLEVVVRHQRDAYRAVYTVTLGDCIYVLHVFQKKSKKGVATPKPDLDCIKVRLKKARDHYRNLARKEEG